jgi:glutamate/tyrosine decarboxylase-like PLP-dependent enzyme
MSPLDIVDERQLWNRVADLVVGHPGTLETHRVAPRLDPERIRGLLARCDFQQPMDPQAALEFVTAAMLEHQVHAPHSRYFGLYNPAPAPMSIIADTLVAAFNPNMAAWSHSPFASEAEQHVIRALGERFGYPPGQAFGVFASGGAEANHTALLAALANAFPEFLDHGLRGLPAQPVFYVSSERHHSFLKAARLCGLGSGAVRHIAVDPNLQLNIGELSATISGDRRAGLAPFLIVATAGTTNAGVIDPIPAMRQLAEQHKVWFHVDAAWAGAVALLPELRYLLDGIAGADSITFDAHKWLSVPMGAGLFLTRHGDILRKTFRTPNEYMPREAAGMDVIDWYDHSMQWSRRWIGLKVFLALLVAGWEGYTKTIRHMVAMGDRLRQELQAGQWRILNDTPLPVVCFADATTPENARAERLQSIVQGVLDSGEAWISTTVLAGTQPAIRACITCFRTGPRDVDRLVEALHRARGACEVPRS